jgi:hypothetical protein
MRCHVELCACGYTLPSIRTGTHDAALRGYDLMYPVRIVESGGGGGKIDSGDSDELLTDLPGRTATLVYQKPQLQVPATEIRSPRTSMCILQEHHA